MINSTFPKASALANWALSKATIKTNTFDYEGETWIEEARLFRGNIGKRFAGVSQEIGTGRIYLVNNEYHQVWIENRAKYVSDFGSFMVGESKFSKQKLDRERSR